MKLYLPLDRAHGRYRDETGRCCVTGAQYHMYHPQTPDDDNAEARDAALTEACWGVTNGSALLINDGDNEYATLTEDERTMLLQLAILSAGHEPVISVR